MLLAIDGLPQVGDPVPAVAMATGLPNAEVRLRLAGILPRMLLVDGDIDRVKAAAQALSVSGISTLILDPATTPTDRDRVIARRLRFDADELHVTSGVGAETEHRCPAHAIALIQRGIRTSVENQTVVSKQRKFAPGRALLSGGLMTRKTTETKHTESTERREAFLLIHRCDEGPDIVCYERRIDYRFLGDEMQPSSFGNLERTLARLHVLTPTAPVDDRVARPGFLTGLPTTGADRVDLGLYLIWLSHLRGSHPRS